MKEFLSTRSNMDMELKSLQMEIYSKDSTSQVDSTAEECITGPTVHVMMEHFTKATEKEEGDGNP